MEDYADKQTFIDEMKLNFEGYSIIDTGVREVIIEQAEECIIKNNVEHITPLEDKLMCSNISRDVFYDSIEKISSKVYDYITIELKEEIILIRHYND